MTDNKKEQGREEKSGDYRKAESKTYEVADNIMTYSNWNVGKRKCSFDR